MIFSDKVNGISKKEFTPEGYLLISGARIARTGTQDYLASELRNEDGTPMFPEKNPTDIIRVERPEKEVFNEDAMRSFELQPVTDDHPPEGVEAKNYKGLAVGVAFNIRRDGIFLLADLKITDTKTIKAIERGKREISNGYAANILKKDGVSPTDGNEFQAIQTTIRGNHVAIVDRARCGPSCSISDKLPKTGNASMKILIDGIPFDVEDETLAAAIKGLATKNADLATKVTTLTATHDAAIASARTGSEEQVQTLQAQLDQAKANEMTPEKLDAVIADRMTIVTTAQKLLKDFDPTGKTCQAIKREVLTLKFGDSISAEKLKNDIYIDARFDALSETAPTAEPAPTSTERLLADAARGSAHNTGATPFTQARARKMVADSISPRFPIGVRQPSHKDHVAFNAAIDAELKRRGELAS